MLINNAKTYDREYVIKTDTDLNEQVHVDVYASKGRARANVYLSHDGDDSYAVIAVEAEDLISLGKSLEAYQNKLKRDGAHGLPL